MQARVFNLGWPAGRVKALLLGWIVSEILTLALVIKVLGFGGAVVLAIGASLLGVALLRRSGRDAAQHLRGALVGSVARDGVLLDGTIAAFGAFLLIVPGFVTDLVGLALSTPSVRRILLARFGGAASAGLAPQRRPAHPEIIDLSPGDWTVVEKPRES